jgi:hypothetical protein
MNQSLDIIDENLKAFSNIYIFIKEKKTKNI